MKHERLSSALVQVAGDKRIAVAALKRLTSRQLTSLQDLINDVMPVVKEAELQLAELEANKIQKAKEISELIQRYGFTLADIEQLQTKPKNATAGTKVSVKYRVFIDNEEHSWTGRGRMPVVFQNLIKEGRKLPEFEV